MTGDYWKMREIAKAEKDRDELREFTLKKYKAQDREVRELTSEQKSEIWKCKVSTEKGKQRCGQSCAALLQI